MPHAGRTAAPPPQVFGFLVKVTDTKEVWVGAYVDWLLAGLVTAATRHVAPGHAVVVVPLSVAVFTVPPATRISIVVRIGGAPPPDGNLAPFTGAKAAPAALPSSSSPASWPPPSPHASWAATVGWDMARPKIPTSASTKFSIVTEHLCTVAARCGVRTAVLEEPGFHWTLPGLREGRVAVQCTIWDGDAVQQSQIGRRSAADGGGVRWVDAAAVSSPTCAAECDGLFLLANVGAATWRRRWLATVESWLLQRRGMSGAGWSVVAVLVVDADVNDGAAESLLRDLQAVTAKATVPARDPQDDTLVPSWTAHPVRSLATMHRYWCFRVWSGAGPCPTPAPTWPGMTYNEKRNRGATGKSAPSDGNV